MWKDDGNQKPRLPPEKSRSSCAWPSRARDPRSANAAGSQEFKHMLAQRGDDRICIFTGYFDEHDETASLLL